MAELDWQQPLATIVRTGTKQAHEDAQSSPGQRLLFSGQLTRETYVKYLFMLWHLYDSLEQALERHASHPALAPTYNPTLLARGPALTSDISYFLQTPPASWKSHPAYKQFVSNLPVPLTVYLTRLRTLSDSDDPSPLLAHAYVRYLGDLSGGSIIGRSIAKHYGLDKGSQGIEFYVFKELTSNNVANQGEMKRIKDWFKEGMDAAGELDQDMKPRILDETLRSYAMHLDLFTVLCDEELMPAVQKESQSGGKDVSSSLPLVMAEKSYSFQVLVVILGVIIVFVSGTVGDMGDFMKLLTAVKQT